MELFKRRPLAFICFLDIIIMIFALNSQSIIRNVLWFVFAISLFLEIVLFICFIKKRNIVHAKRIAAFIFFTVIALALIASSNIFASKNDYIKVNSQTVVDVTGSVTNVRYRSSSESSLEVKISSINEEKTDVNIIMNVSSHSSLKSGDSFSAKGNLSILSVSEEAFFIADGFNGRLTCEGEDVKIKGVQTDNYNTIFKKANAYLQKILSENTNEETGSLVGALLLGNRDNLSDITIRDFARCGISHMLALSGLHMSIIIGFFDFIMRNLFVDKRVRCFVLIFISLAYLAITGFSPSASRSVIMLCIVYLSYILSNETDSITSLFIAVTLILLISPCSAYDIGLWLSFFATLGILVVSDIVSVLKYHIKKKPLYVKALVYLTVSIAITLVAVFFTCFFTWLYSGKISLLSPLTNLIFSPLMTIILIAGLILIFISPIPFFAGAVGESLKYIASVFTSAASSISHLRGITVSLKYDFVPYIIIPLVLVLMIFLVIKLKRKWIMFVPPLLSVMAFVIALNTYNVKNTDQFDVIYLKDKRSDMLIVSTIDETSICDISTGGYANLYLACNESESFEYLTEIENFIITHYHNYHVSSLEKICNKYMIRNVYLPLAENEEDAQAQSKIIEALKPTGTRVKLYKKGSSIKDSNGNAITVSENAYVDRSSHPVFTICVSGGAKSFVYATSSAFEIDNIKPALQVDVLIIGSHGPTIKSFSENEFLSNYFESVPHMIVFSSPNEMLDNQDAISYINYLYQKGHKIIIDGKNYYRFKLD